MANAKKLWPLVLIVTGVAVALLATYVAPR